MDFHQKLRKEWEQKATKLIVQTADDLIKKNLLEDWYKRHIKEPTMLNAAVQQYAKQAMTSFYCPECGITIKGPKQYAMWHGKTHYKPKKENEMQISKFTPYFH